MMELINKIKKIKIEESGSEIYEDDVIAKKKELLGTGLAMVATTAYYVAEACEEVAAAKGTTIKREWVITRILSGLVALGGILFIVSSNKQKSPERKIQRAKEYREHCNKVIADVESNGGHRYEFHNAWLPKSVATAIEEESFTEHDKIKKNAQ